MVRKRVEVSGESLVDAHLPNEPVVGFRFDTAGGRKFGNVTREHVGELLAIVLDDKVISSPRIREPILGGSGVISGSFTVQARTARGAAAPGALPAPLEIVEERSVGARPRRRPRSPPARSPGWSHCGLVMGLMSFYYGLFGVAACVALVVNLILIMGVLSALQATLTLPGIAGIVLTIGMAVDANVLIFERIREEVGAAGRRSARSTRATARRCRRSSTPTST